MSKSKRLSQQRKIALLLIVWRLPELVTSFIAACASGSAVVWLEFVECASIVLPGAILVILTSKLNRNLKYVFNYGTGKVEAITALSCEMFDVAGIMCLMFFSIRSLLGWEAETGNSRFALAVSILGLIIDIFIMLRQKKILEESHSKMYHTAYVSAQKEFAFDAASIITLIITIIFEGTVWIRYFSPVVCIIIAIPLSRLVFGHLRESVEELIDRTLDEENQLKIIKVINEHFDKFEELGAVKSRITGQEKYIDIEMKFHEDMQYSEVREVAQQISRRISEELGHSNVNIVVI
ncbi:cation transporter [Butyrivibrio sp. DSM 10294]|uniref:cation transporter n=1 Tax=Butyrivibrio sp. DSM 10294 TaxID=2972457 RepID=UPI00234F97E4|nr:cation transporter [Butyrivibrio sp. DSM 10294]MDC7292714.1 cation transporter [Butyrivibrio sp. DSM 10294]